MQALSLTDEDLLEVERELCRRSLAAFVKRAWPNIIPDKLVWGWHLDALSEHLEAVASGEINRLLINIPPGTSKSTMVGVMFPAWLWGPYGQPWHKYIGAAHEQGLAVRDNRLMRYLVTSEWYQSLWPIKMTGDQNEKLYFENEHMGFRQACAVESMTGRRGHTVVWDDPLSPKKANSKAHRDEAIRILTETVPTRLNDPETSSIIIIMQRLHENDPAGYILSNDLGYEHLCIPMEYEPDRKCVTSIGWQDPRTKEGEIIDPVRFPKKVIARDKKMMGSYAWAAQMQQRPAPRGGGILKDEWWQYYKVAPRIVYRTIYADTAMKTSEQNDYSVFQCWGKGADGKIYLLDMVRGKWEAPELLTIAKSFWAKHREEKDSGVLRKIMIEDKSSGTGLIQQMKRHNIPVEGIPRDRDKITRALDVAPQIECGNVLLPDGAPFVVDILSEASGFPNAAHDDCLDPLFDAVNDMLIGDSVVDYAKLI